MSDFSDAEAQALRRAMATSFVDAQRAKPFAEGRKELQQAINTLIDRQEIISREEQEARLDYRREHLLVGEAISDDAFFGMMASPDVVRHGRETFILGQEISIIAEGLGQSLIANNVPYVANLVGGSVVATLTQQPGRDELELPALQQESFRSIGLYDAAVGLTHGSDTRGLRDVDMSLLAPDRLRRATNATNELDNMVVEHISFGEKLEARRSTREPRVTSARSSAPQPKQGLSPHARGW